MKTFAHRIAVFAILALGIVFVGGAEGRAQAVPPAHIAIVDYLLTLAVAVLTTYISHIPLVLSTIGWFSLGIFFHIIFGVQTDVIKKLGIKC